MRHNTHILWDHTTFCMTSHALFLDNSPTVYDTTSTLSVSSRPVHQLYHTNTRYDITHTLCMTSQSVFMTSHEHFMTSHPYKYDITEYIYDIITIYMISTLLLSWKHNNTWHHTHYICHHSHCICAAKPALSIVHKNFGSYPSWNTYDIINTLHDITVTLYDIIPQCLWHHSHCIHDIRSPK